LTKKHKTQRTDNNNNNNNNFSLVIGLLSKVQRIDVGKIVHKGRGQSCTQNLRGGGGFDLREKNKVSKKRWN
jgi:hypothetical protein